MANHYLIKKFKGKYRILPELDEVTHDIPRNEKGEIAEGYDDIYIACQYGNKITSYGHGILQAYIPSITRGRKIKRILDKKKVLYSNYHETDKEVEFKFKTKDIDFIGTLLKAKTTGANISPFSVKNLPKNNVKIPLGEIEVYKKILNKIRKEDLLIISNITNQFLSQNLTQKFKGIDKCFNYKIDMRKLKMGRMRKEYIWAKGMWNEYLSYLEQQINLFYGE